MKDTKAALNWIITLLNENNISYQIVGGLAAKTHGATRELVDIDMYVAGADFQKVCVLVKSFTIWGPKVYKDDHWDCEYVKMNHSNQNIEIGNSDNTKRFDHENNVWVSEKIDYSKSEKKEFLGIKIKVMPKKQLIEYKRKLNREVDVIDIQQMG
jgi:hypothetical protein